MAGLRGGRFRPHLQRDEGRRAGAHASAGAELGEKGVRVNSISPGAIVTGIFAKNAGVEAAKADKLTDISR